MPAANGLIPFRLFLLARGGVSLLAEFKGKDLESLALASGSYSAEIQAYEPWLAPKRLMSITVH